MASVREEALKCLYRIDEKDAYSSMVIESAVKKLDNRDARLLSEIVFGVMRHRLYLDHIIKSLSTKGIKKISVWTLNILRMGVYCIKFIDKIPVRATVDECVKLSHKYGFRGSSGFVNAILRKVDKEKDYLDSLTGDELLEIKYSCPKWIIEKFRTETDEAEKLLEQMNTTPTRYVRLNTLKTKDIPKECEKTDFLEETLILKEESNLFEEGIITYQDASAQLASRVLNPKKGAKVLDLCGAPGIKTTHLGAIMENEGEIIACDIHEHKLPLIEKNAERMGVKIIKTVKNDATVYNKEFENRFDYIMADVTCSGLGTIRRRPDIRYRKTENDTNELSKIQEKMLFNASRYLKIGGKLLYSTCTINREENQSVVEKFLEKNKNFSLVPFCVGNISSDGFLQLMPHTHKTDGFFIALITKEA